MRALGDTTSLPSIFNTGGGGAAATPSAFPSVFSQMMATTSSPDSGSSSNWLTGTVGSIINSLGGTGVLQAAGPSIAALISSKLTPAIKAAKEPKAPKAPVVQAAPAPARTTPSWVLPVAIGAGVLLLGGVVLVATKRR